MSDERIHDGSQLAGELQDERLRLRREFKECEQILRQLNVELSSVEGQRSAAADRLREIKLDPSAFPYSEIVDAFDDAMKSEVRSILIQSQIEQLRFRQSSMGGVAEQIVRLSDMLDGLLAHASTTNSADHPFESENARARTA
ncbi:MAG: hypothetical protein HW416_1267 [Chloroflexi bacterium]|nr:hypothetical protein [Chloroflexota bacterium]